MGVKVYVSGISGNKEVKKRQQRVMMIMESKNIQYEVVDIAEPGKESDKDFMQTNATANGATVSDPNPRNPLPPQLFNDKEYCGDYDQFDMANEVDELEKFLKLSVAENQVSTAEVTLGNGEVKSEGEAEADKPEPETNEVSESSEAPKDETVSDENTKEVADTVDAKDEVLDKVEHESAEPEADESSEKPNKEEADEVVENGANEEQSTNEVEVTSST